MFVEFYKFGLLVVAIQLLILNFDGVVCFVHEHILWVEKTVNKYKKVYIPIWTAAVK